MAVAFHNGSRGSVRLGQCCGSLVGSRRYCRSLTSQKHHLAGARLVFREPDVHGATFTIGLDVEVQSRPVGSLVLDLGTGLLPGTLSGGIPFLSQLVARACLRAHSKGQRHWRRNLRVVPVHTGMDYRYNLVVVSSDELCGSTRLDGPTPAWIHVVHRLQRIDRVCQWSNSLGSRTRILRFVRDVVALDSKAKLKSAGRGNLGPAHQRTLAQESSETQDSSLIATESCGYINDSNDSNDSIENRIRPAVELMTGRT